MRRRHEKPQWQLQKQQQTRRLRQDSNGENWLATALRLSYFLPGLLLGFMLGLWQEIPKGKLMLPASRSSKSTRNSTQAPSDSRSESDDGELKMVFVVRQDLKMGGGKIASQCAHAAVGIYSDLMRSNRSLLSKWESCGQPKIVVTCKNQQEMNELRARAERAGLPTFVIADAGRTQCGVWRALTGSSGFQNSAGYWARSKASRRFGDKTSSSVVSA